MSWPPQQNFNAGIKRSIMLFASLTAAERAWLDPVTFTRRGRMFTKLMQAGPSRLALCRSGVAVAKAID
jgi:hypothetical protein